MLYLWYCSNCFDSGVSPLSPVRCPSCGSRAINSEPEKVTKESLKEFERIEMDKEIAKKRTK